MSQDVKTQRITVGRVGIALSVCIIVLFGYSVIRIVPLFTELPKIDETAKKFEETFGPKSFDRDFVKFLYALEYESYAIRLQGLQVIVGYIIGTSLVTLGLLLMSTNIATTTEFSASGMSFGISLSRIGPGLVLAIVGGIIIFASISKGVHRYYEVDTRGAAKATLGTSQTELPFRNEGLEYDVDKSARKSEDTKPPKK